MHRHQSYLVFGTERQVPCHQFIQQYAEGVEVAQGIGTMVRLEEVGRGIIDSTQHTARARQWRCLVYHARTTKVCQIAGTISAEQDIRGLDIAVNNALGMQIVESIRD